MRVAAAVLGAAIGLATALPAHADFGAIAFDAKSGKRGWSIREPTAERAAQKALSACGAGECKVIIRVKPKFCAAVAGIEGKTIIGAAARPNRDAARTAALANCQKNASSDCLIQFSDCNH